MNSANSIGLEKPYELRVLHEEHRPIAGEMARYRFCELDFAGSEYYAEILMGTERAGARLCRDYTRAKRLFDALVAGTVTPCTLIDVVTDAKNSHISPLQEGKIML